MAPKPEAGGCIAAGSGSQRTARSAFAQSYARSIANSGNKNANAQVVAQATVAGGNQLAAMSVAITAAFTSGDESLQFAFSEAIAIAIDAYGCETISIAISGMRLFPLAMASYDHIIRQGIFKISADLQKLQNDNYLQHQAWQ